jgi:hypothetical protein
VLVACLLAPAVEDRHQGVHENRPPSFVLSGSFTEHLELDLFPPPLFTVEIVLLHLHDAGQVAEAHLQLQELCLELFVVLLDGDQVGDGMTWLACGVVRMMAVATVGRSRFHGGLLEE